MKSHYVLWHNPSQNSIFTVSFLTSPGQGVFSAYKYSNQTNKTKFKWFVILPSDWHWGICYYIEVLYWAWRNWHYWAYLGQSPFWVGLDLWKVDKRNLNYPCNLYSNPGSTNLFYNAWIFPLIIWRFLVYAWQETTNYLILGGNFMVAGDPICSINYRYSWWRNSSCVFMLHSLATRNPPALKQLSTQPQVTKQSRPRSLLDDRLSLY